MEESEEAVMSQFKTLMMIVLLSLPSVGWAQSGQGSFNFRQRAEKRESTRWTLQEWLEQRDRSRMMDLWLSMNSPSPFEVMLGGSYLATTTGVDNPKSEQNFSSYTGELAAYAQFVGLGAEHENNVQEGYGDVSGMLNLRLLGNSLQNSHLTLHFGQRTRTFGGTTPNPQRNVFSQATLQLYIARYFGLKGHYRYYEPSTNDLLSEQIGGTQSEAGLFIDFNAIRVYGSWYNDVEKHSGGATDFSVQRQGIKSGFVIFY